MSYDFVLFKPRDDEDPLVTAQRDSQGFSSSPPDPQKEALKRRVADALINHDPKLAVFEFRYDQIAKLEKTSVEEARLKYRHLELNGPEDDGKGIQITLFDDEASVTVPFWHAGTRAEDVFREIWNYLKIIAREAGYVIYDPQIDRIIDPAKGFDESLACYTGVMSRMHDSPPPSFQEKKPWWKFW